MFVLLLVLIVVLFGLGFLNPLWWVAAAVLVFGATRHGRDRGGGWIRGDWSDLGGNRDYENRRDRQGVGGGVARGGVFAAAGIFILVAAVRFDPDEAKGVDATLRSFTQTPVGPGLLVAVAIGLIVFGVFSFASARWRRL